MEKRVNILIVDDEAIIRDSLKSWLREDGYYVEAVEDGMTALKRLPEKEWTLFLVDLKMPGMDGIQVLEEIRKRDPGTLVIIMTAYATVDTAVKALKKGAYDYLVKPFDPENLSILVQKIIAHQKLVKENIYLRRELRKKYHLHDLISKNDRMMDIFELVRSIAGSSSTVLIQGESGTGKELLARAIHEESDRKNRRFVSVSCASLTDSLLESELFGYEKGAFTGAHGTRRGKLELAGEGTLFLDEIGDISLKLQMDLLRVLEERKFMRVGGSALISIGARVIAATNKDLKEALREGSFRDDLYYRLNVIPIHIPPLRERKEDIPLLVDHFIEKFNIEMDKCVEGLDRKAIRKLIDYNWPGNARELRNVIERGMVITQGKTILESEISLPTDQVRGGTNGGTLEELERNHIRSTLHENGWNIHRSARILGIDRGTLYNKIRKYNLKKDHGDE